MSLVSGDQLAFMRAQVQNTLPQSAILYSPSLASDGAGGQTETLTSMGTVACRLDPLASRPRDSALVAGREALLLAYQATFPYDTTLDVDYRVAIEGRTYQVLQIDNKHGWNVSVRAIVQEIR